VHAEQTLEAERARAVHLHHGFAHDLGIRGHAHILGKGGGTQQHS